MRPIRSAMTSLLLTLLSAAGVSAHPHMWITARVDFHFTQEGLSGFREQWKFDTYDSADIISSFDANKDGRFDSAEIAAIRSGYFDNIAEYRYFTTVRNGTQVWQPTVVKDFFAWTVKNIVYYRFDVSFAAPATRTDSQVSVTVWDPSYFVDFSLAGGPPGASVPVGITVECSRANDYQDHYRFPPDLLITQAPPTYLSMAVVRFRTAG